MALKVSFNDPAFPKDEEFDLGGVLVKNGGSVTLTEDQERAILARFGMTAKDYFADSEAIKVEGTAEVKGKEVKEGGEG
jgi:hypothetical protein